MRDLVVRARGGDRDAFSELAARSLGRLTAVARLILRDEYAAQDAVQEAFIEAWKSLPGLRDPDHGSPQQIGIWLSAGPEAGSDCEPFLASTDFANIGPEILDEVPKHLHLSLNSRDPHQLLLRRSL